MAIEHEVVVPAHRVAIENRDSGRACHLGEHGFPPAGFSDGERGCAKVENALGSLLDKGTYRGASIEGTRQVRLGPDVFAEGDPDFFPGDENGSNGGWRFKVAGFVKDIVGGKQGFERFLDGGVFLEDGGGVPERAAGLGMEIDVADHQGNGTDLGGEGVEGFQVRGDKPGFEHEVLRGVSGKGQFRGQHTVGAFCDELLIRRKDQAPVGVEIADGGVDLC
jgi:hypothetical protein